MEIQNPKAFYKRFKRVERKEILQSERSLDSSAEKERELNSDRLYIQNFNAYNNGAEVRKSIQTIKSPIIPISDLSSLISIKYPESTSNTAKSKLERISRIFSINPSNNIKEVRFNTCESYELANEIDTDREIIASATIPKY